MNSLYMLQTVTFFVSPRLLANLHFFLAYISTIAKLIIISYFFFRNSLKECKHSSKTKFYLKSWPKYYNTMWISSIQMVIKHITEMHLVVLKTFSSFLIKFSSKSLSVDTQTSVFNKEGKTSYFYFKNIDKLMETFSKLFCSIKN